MRAKREAVLFFMPTYRGFHTAAWRAEKDIEHSVEMDFSIVRRQIQLAERGKFHAAFFADGLVVGMGPADVSLDALSRTTAGSKWEPLTLLSALAACTKQIGLLGTVSTSYSQPYNIARMFASLDHISGGRAGWNVVTSAHPKVGLNFGDEALMPHDERYALGEEYFDVVAGLWDSWEDDAFLRDKASGRYFDPAKLHALNHRGKYLSVAGPLNIARPLQGHPVIAQAGSSAPGRAFAARHADVIYTMQAEIAQAKAFYSDVKNQADAAGRNPDHVKILPAVIFSVGHSMAHAEDKLARLDALVDPVVGMELLGAVLKMDLTPFPLDGPLPEVPVDQSGSRTTQQYFVDIARRDKLTIRQLIQVMARVSSIAGDATSIADRIEEWMEAGAADGLNIQFANDEDSLPIFVEEVIPELQRRGLFHRDYRGKTLRENLGLPRPANRFVPDPDAASVKQLTPAM
ncbi:LLM class flavin-dependent oxidoreductase [Sphingobium sp. Sx8-8]|uniref:LLM class flavin-dependent oxidoreductase n=1 Tax=Sphingobium sp. Sx8-8 TaxID=2933617 RepID=UPI001F5A41DB|nr:LLM class flavin-dependent oxidoreductase [Sphingobium sp. Sx8-8]